MIARLRPHLPYIAFLLLTWGTYWVVLLAHSISWRPDGVYLGSVNLWSDWALHITLANRFAYLSPHDWFISHPLYAGGRLNYPFLADFISGMLLRLKFSLQAAMIAPSIITAIGLLLAAYGVLYKLLRSKGQAILAISIFFLSSGLGFIHFWHDLQANPSFSMFQYPPIEYSRIDAYEWYSGNVIVGMLFPQRAFLLGMFVALVALYQLITALQAPDLKTQRGRLVGAGLLAGLLTITHPHSLIALVIMSFFLCLPRFREWKTLLWYVLPASVIVLVLYKIFIAGTVEVSSFMKWSPGWTSHTLSAWISQWWQQWGIMIPLALLSYLALYRRLLPEARRVFLAGFAILILSNLIVFQPVYWDNSKLFTWSYFLFSGLTAAMIGILWRIHWFTKLIAAILFFLLTATGTLELIRLQRTDINSYQETSTEDINLGLQIRQATDPSAVFLTDNAHNEFVMIWGVRSVFLGFTPWVENFGFPSTPRYWDTVTMYKGGDAAAALFKKDNISYVIIGPGELYSFAPNTAYFAQNYPIAFQDSSTIVYDVRGAAPSSSANPL